MEAKLFFFIVFTFVTLTANAAFIWLAYKAYASAAERLTRGMQEFRGGKMRGWLDSLESASSQALEITRLGKEHVKGFEPKMARVHSTYGFALAKVDINFERLCNNISYHTERAQRAVTRPAEKVSAAVSGLQTVLEFSELLGIVESDERATSKQKQRAVPSR